MLQHQASCKTQAWAAEVSAAHDLRKGERRREDGRKKNPLGKAEAQAGGLCSLDSGAATQKEIPLLVNSAKL